MFLIVGTVAGLALYTTFSVKASMAGIPEAVAYLPADCQAVFGMNVQKFIASPIYGKFEQQHGHEYGNDLAEFIEKTGVDPRRDIAYIVAGGKSIGDRSGKGVVIASGQFDQARITDFINAHHAPIRADYKNATVLMVPEENGNKVDKGIAFLGGGEIALGDLESLKEVLDVRENPAKGLQGNAVLWPLLKDLNPDEMFWFAGDPGTVLSKAPTNTPLGGSIAAIKSIVGTLNLTDAVTGKITATASDEESAKKLADVAKGIVALGQLAGSDNQEISELVSGINISQDKKQVRLMLNFSIDLLDRLQHSKPAIKKVV
jgi:hypothetical protein